uniref:Uncharacterized protein n=1 Tax=Daphnia galeata TaxID=27404 RepID=A0A8J2WDP5_9CRUS|nr:unnamed protein product [Daphnia galeata]
MMESEVEETYNLLDEVDSEDFEDLSIRYASHTLDFIAKTDTDLPNSMQKNFPKRRYCVKPGGNYAFWNKIIGQSISESEKSLEVFDLRRRLMTNAT